MATIESTIENGILTIRITGHPDIVIDPAEMPPALNEYAALHGYKQRILDAAALSRDPTTGRPATPAEKYSEMRRLADHMVESGEWRRNAAGDGTAGDGLLVRAVMEACGLDRTAARAAVGQWDRKTQAAMRADPTIAPIIARLRTERPARAAGVDTAAKLAELMNR